MERPKFDGEIRLGDGINYERFNRPFNLKKTNAFMATLQLGIFFLKTPGRLPKQPEILRRFARIF